MSGRKSGEAAERKPAGKPMGSELSITRVLDAPREKVWKAWTVAEEVKKWWGPKDFTAPLISIDFRVGGRFIFSMRGAGPDGVVRDYWNTGEHLDIVTMEKVVTTMKFADEKGNAVPASHYGLPGEWPDEITLTAVFEDAPGGRTRLTVRETGIPEVMQEMARMGWEQSLDKFAEALGTKAAAKTGTQDILITREFDAPREQVWKAWTDSEEVKKWWGPKGFTTPFCKIDLRVGGAVHYCMRSPDGKDYWGTGVYREIAEPERIVCTDSFADEKGNVVPATNYGMSPDFPLELLVTVTFEEHKGGTRLTLRHAGFPSGPDYEMARQGWGESLDKLAEELRAARPERKLRRAS